jgi:hypothetical protein
LLLSSQHGGRPQSSEMSYEESVSYFQSLEKLEKIRRTNGPIPLWLPIDNNFFISFTSSVGKSKWIIRGLKCGFTVVTITTTTRLIAEILLVRWISMYRHSVPFCNVHVIWFGIFGGEMKVKFTKNGTWSQRFDSRKSFFCFIFRDVFFQHH